MPSLPPVFIEFLGSSKGVQAAMGEVKVALAEADESGAGAFQKSGMLGTAAILGLGVAAVEAGKKSVEAAADFETQMTRVQTGAGEAQANMRSVSAGVLAMAGQVGQTTEQLTSGLYTVESAGYHGSAALDVLKNSAMGAKVGAADLGTVADAVTTAMNAYKMSADQSAEATNALIATEGEGKTTLEALSGAMATVLPTAATAKVGLNEVLGAMATMTAQGTPAADAATYLRQTIAQLSNPSGKAAQEMQSLGLNSVQVSQNLGKNGLASTLEELTDAIQKKMGPAGTVLIQHLQAAAKDSTAYQKVLAGLKPEQQTYIGALADMVGGTKSMQAALELTGPHMADFKANTAGIADHVKAGGKEIEGWTQVQGTLNQKLAEAKGAGEALMIQVGQELLPVLTKAAGVLAEGVTWLTKHHGAAVALASVIGGVLVFALAAATAALWGMAAAAAANPVTWIILGVVALVAAIVLLIVHWRAVWAEVKAISADVAHVAVEGWDWLSGETARAWHDITGWVVGAWHDLEGWADDAWHGVADPIVHGWHWLLGATEDAWQDLEGWADDAWHGVVDPIVHGWDWLVHGTEDAWRDVTGWVVNSWRSAVAWVAHTAREVAEPIMAAFGAVLGFFATWWPLLVAIFLPWVAGLIGLWNRFSGTVWSATVTAWTAIMGFFVGVWHGIEHGAEAGWRGINTAIVHPAEEAWAWLADTWTSGEAWLEGAWHDIEHAADAGWREIQAVIVQPVEEAWTWLTGVWTSGVTWLDGVWHGIERDAEAGWRGVQHYIVQPVEEAWDWLAGLWTSGEAWLGRQWALIRAGAQVTWALIYGDIVHPIEDAWRDVTQTADKIGSAVSSAFTAAKKDAGALVTDFERFGSDLVGGIVKGITSAAHLVGEKLKSLASDALKEAKSFMGISSPSRVMADEFGRWLPHGIAMGIEEHADVAQQALGRVAGALAAQPLAVPALAGAGSGAAGGGAAGTAVLQVEFPLVIQLDGQALYQGVQRLALRYDRRNAAPGLIRATI